ncbi:MAG: xanthine dehydrogenase family protein molybdopterin-binding subunit [Dehalococcoidia bacterium]|nr:xanthine dehydrogenase family protein molybdopterin-binding subunit [Dehalococcoidia bacterium]
MSSRFIGERLARVDAPDRVTGRAVYAADISLSGMLHGRVLRSPHAHAYIKKIDATRALALEGVKAVVTAADFPALKKGGVIARGEVELNLDHIRQVALAHGKVLYHGHAVAAVAATDPHIAEDALELIEVEYEPLLAVLDPEEAMKEDAPLVHPEQRTRTRDGTLDRPSNIAATYNVSRGDVEEGFQVADVVVEHTFRTRTVHQGYLEPMAAVARADPGGRITVWASTQGNFSLRSQLASVLELNSSQVKVVPVEIGGGFGGKLNSVLELPAVLLARRTGRPVKLVMSREEVLRATYPAPATAITVKAGATADGRLTAVKMRAVFDAGAFPIAPVVAAYLTSLAPYKIPHICLEGYEVVTNHPKIGALRAPGAPQGAFAVEGQMDLLAEKLDIDSLELRRRNATQEGEPMPVGRAFNRIGLQPLLERVAAHPSWTTPLKGPHRGRGLAVAFWPGAVMPSSCNLTLQDDGSFSLVVGSVDLTGTRTTMLQVAAQELGVHPSKISVSVGDTDSVGHTEVSGGSRITYTMSNAVNQACTRMLGLLRERAAAELEVDPQELEYDTGIFSSRVSQDKRLTLTDLGRQSLRRGGPVTATGAVARMQPAPAFSAHVVDVEVDMETGQVKLLNYTAFQDVGRAVNPTQVEGQIQGGAVQGIGWALMEGYQFSESGVLQNANLLDYKTPTATDVPFIDTVILEIPASDGPYGIRGVGETPIIPPLPALANAIHNATGVRIRELPMNPEALFHAMQGRGG